MLKKLRLRLTLLCVALTGGILLIMALSALSLSERQAQNAQAAIFQNQIDAIVAKLQNDRLISGSWLKQMEVSTRLIIAIEDNRTPLLFSGAWSPPEGREKLIETARSTAKEVYGVDIKSPPVSVIQTTQAKFSVGNRYRAAAVLVPVDKGFCSLTLLMDDSAYLSSLKTQRLALLSLSALCAVLLGVFSYWFAGKAIRPIQKNLDEQTQFIAAASHELKAPLAVIRTSVSALTVEPREAPRFMKNIELECVRLSRLVEDLLLLAGSDAKTWQIRSKPLDVDRLLIETVEKMQGVIRESGHTLSFSLPDEVFPPIMGDFDRLQQILMILLDNASHYTPQGKPIELSGRLSGHSILLSVIDHGPGIKTAQKQRVFDRFYRADIARTDRAHFGLGLSIAKELARLHGGSLALRDTPGGGCTFTLHLPVSKG